MSFTFGEAKSNPNSGDGIFIDTVKIVRLKPYYNSSPEFLSKPHDLGLEITYLHPKGWESNTYIGGNFKRNAQGVIVGAGSAFKLDRLFQKIDVKFAFDDEMHIPQEALEAAIGKSFNILSYRNTNSTEEKLRTSQWDLVGAADGYDDEYLRGEFLKQYNERGYPQKYMPAAGAESGAANEVVDTIQSVF